MQSVRSQGAGGQNVNKVSTAVHLRFDIRASSLPDAWKERLLALNDHRISSDGVVIIKAQRHRTQERNREDALRRLQDFIENAIVVRKKRTATQPTKGSQARRLESKTTRSQLKAKRAKVDYSE